MGRSQRKNNKVSNSGARSALLGEDGLKLKSGISVSRNMTINKLVEILQGIQKESVRDGQLSIDIAVGSFKEKAVFKEDLFGINFRGYDFSLSELVSVNFGHEEKKLASNLELASFKDANLKDISFKHVNLKKANLSGANLNFSKFNQTDLSGADTTKATFFGSEFKDMGPGSLDCVYAGDNLFNTAKFSQCVRPFSQETDLNGVSFLAAEFDDVLFTPGQKMKNAILFEVSMNDSSMHGVDLSGANLATSHIADTDMQSSKLVGADLAHVSIKNVNFYQANFTDADLAYSEIKDSVFADSNFERADLNGAVFNNCHFARADITKAKNRSKAKFVNCTGLNF